jgi:hypothetical protein
MLPIPLRFLVANATNLVSPFNWVEHAQAIAFITAIVKEKLPKVVFLNAKLSGLPLFYKF